MPITASLTAGQRRLMNVLHDVGTALAGTNPMKAINRAECDHEDVVELARLDLVEVRWRNGDGSLIDITAVDVSAFYVTHVRLRLSNPGISWVNENPTNRLLRALDAKSRGFFDLRDASVACDDDAVIIGIVADGFATLHYKGDMKQTKFDRADGRYEFRHGADYVLIPTPKIRTVLGPKA